MTAKISSILMLILIAIPFSGCPPEENAGEEQPRVRPGDWVFTLTIPDGSGPGIDTVFVAGTHLLVTGVGAEYSEQGATLSVPLNWTQNGSAFYMNQSEQRMWYEARIEDSMRIEGHFFHEVDPALDGQFVAVFIRD